MQPMLPKTQFSNHWQNKHISLGRAIENQRMDAGKGYNADDCLRRGQQLPGAPKNQSIHHRGHRRTQRKTSARKISSPRYYFVTFHFIPSSNFQITRFPDHMIPLCPPCPLWLRLFGCNCVVHCGAYAQVHARSRHTITKSSEKLMLCLRAGQPRRYAAEIRSG